MRSDDAGRDVGLDLLRIVACFSLIPFHYCIYGMRHESMSLNYIDTFVKTLFEYHIPLFLMISGTLFFRRQKLDIRRLYTHNVVHLLLVYVFWSAVYAVFDVLINLGNVTGVLDLAKWIIMDIRDSHYHLWYIPMIIAIYIMYPVFHAAFGSGGDTVLKYAVAVFVIFGVIVKTLLLIPIKYDTYSVMLEKIDVGTFAGYIGFTFVGYLLYTNRDRITKKTVRILVLLSVVSLIITEIVNLSQVPSEGINTYFLYFPVPCFIIECTLFLLFIRIPSERLEKRGELISKVAQCMLGVYAIHDLVMSVVDMVFGFMPESLHLVRMLLVIPLSFVLSVGIVMLMRRSRLLRRIAV